MKAGRRVRLERVGLVAIMALATVNVWTGSPLLALWIGSRVQGGDDLNMLAVAVVTLVVAAQSFVLVRILARLDALYGRVTGRRVPVRRHVPWLRSMRGERAHAQRGIRDLTALEVVL